MVRLLSPWASARWSADWLLAAEEKQAAPLLMRLDPAVRAKVLMALLGLVLVGLLLVAMAWLGGRHLRRIARKAPTPPVDHRDDWYRKPLTPGDRSDTPDS
jgi:hypothetical protein